MFWLFRSVETVILKWNMKNICNPNFVGLAGFFNGWADWKRSNGIYSIVANFACFSSSSGPFAVWRNESCCKCISRRHSIHRKRTSRMFDILVDIFNYGGNPICGEISEMYRYANGRKNWTKYYSRHQREPISLRKFDKVSYFCIKRIIIFDENYNFYEH